MRKIINRKTYNTDTAKLVKHTTFSYYGDSAGYEEFLYQTPKGDYFVYGIGGKTSKYPIETIIAVTPAEAAEF